LGRIGFERQSETSKLVLQVEESWDLFILKELHRGGSNNPLKYNSFHNVTFGTQITTRPSTFFEPINFHRTVCHELGHNAAIRIMPMASAGGRFARHRPRGCSA